MDRMTRTPRRKPACRLLGLGLLTIGAGLLAPGLVSAAPIKRASELAEARHAAEPRAADEDYAAHPRIFQSWSGYLKGGRSVWSTFAHPPLTPAVETAIWHALKTDRAETNPLIEFLLWKQGRDEARFDCYHPCIARALRKLSPPHTETHGTTPPSSNPGSGTNSPAQGQQIEPNVPEPASWLVALGLAGWALRWRRRMRGESAIADKVNRSA
jgi:hypothetical protein